MKSKPIGILILLVLITTGIWIITMLLNADVNAYSKSTQEKIVELQNIGPLFYITYINAALITMFTVAMLAGFYYYCNNINPLWSIIAFAFVPIYGMGNLTAYLSQIFVVPALVEIYQVEGYETIIAVLTGQILHDWPRSAMGYLNTVSYGILGIPSIIFSLIFMKLDKKLRTGSILLMVSGILSIMAVIGLAMENKFLIIMLAVGGVIYFIALIFLSIYFLRQVEAT